MFKVHNLTTPKLFNKLTSLHSSKSKRKEAAMPGGVSLSLLQATGALSVASDVQRANEQVHVCNLPLISHLPLTSSSLDLEEGESHLHHHNHSQSFEDDPHNSHHSKPFHPQYPSERVFKAALQLYNKQIGEMNGSPTCSKSLQRWEYKGQIRASLQLCVLCKDIGKAKSFKEKYYLNVLEVKKYRSILCNGCLGYILCKHVGTCYEKIEERLQELDG